MLDPPPVPTAAPALSQADVIGQALGCVPPSTVRSFEENGTAVGNGSASPKHRQQASCLALYNTDDNVSVQGLVRSGDCLWLGTFGLPQLLGQEEDEEEDNEQEEEEVRGRGGGGGGKRSVVCSRRDLCEIRNRVDRKYPFSYVVTSMEAPSREPGGARLWGPRLVPRL